MIPHYFAMDETAAREFAIKLAAGTLVSVDDDGQFHTSFLPILWRGDEIIMHMGRANSHWRVIGQGRRSIMFFTGPNGYVSALDYDLPEEMSSASTWDYTHVEVHGHAQVIPGQDFARQAALDLSYHHEVAAAQQLTEDYLQRTSKAIVGLTFTVDTIRGAAKLSQNKLPHEREKIIARLRASKTPRNTALADDIAAAPSKARRVPYTGALRSVKRGE
ncbi:MAG: FMN-binding negative transcriptional regulator [Bowdeniella nasicola]|nr:FMN-binding negative transcriptional regulator [Bowdeniella nasicola]